MKTPLCALILLFACTGAAETLWPGDGTVGLVAGNCATVETRGGLALVHVGACKATLWPGAYFAFPAPRDLSRAGAVKVTFTNCTDRALRLAVKVKGETVQGRLP